MLEQLNAHMETDDDNDSEARIASQYRMLTMHDPEFLTIPKADDENILTRDELKLPMPNSSKRRFASRLPTSSIPPRPSVH